MFRAAPLAAALALLAAGCAQQPRTALSGDTSAAAANRAAIASCRASTERSFNQQNRYLLSEQDTTDSPFSTSGVPGITTRGLTQRMDYDDAYSTCLAASRASNAVVGTPAAGPPPTNAGTPVAPY